MTTSSSRQGDERGKTSAVRRLVKLTIQALVGLDNFFGPSSKRASKISLWKGSREVTRERQAKGDARVRGTKRRSFAPRSFVLLPLGLRRCIRCIRCILINE